MRTFYNLRKEDFIIVLAASLEVGDMLSLLGPNNLFGIAHVDHITNCRGQLVVIEFELPDGATIQSSDRMQLEARWDGKRHAVKVTLEYNAVERVQILDVGVDRYVAHLS
jgi:hypothetical protein